jgi:hypothetical protein
MTIVHLDDHSDIVGVYGTSLSEVSYFSFPSFGSCVSLEIGCRS